MKLHHTNHSFHLLLVTIAHSLCTMMCNMSVHVYIHVHVTIGRVYVRVHVHVHVYLLLVSITSSLFDLLKKPNQCLCKIHVHVYTSIYISQATIVYYTTDHSSWDQNLPGLLSPFESQRSHNKMVMCRIIIYTLVVYI